MKGEFYEKKVIRSRVELASNQVLFDGTVFDVPMPVRDIEKLGWKTSNNNEFVEISSKGIISVADLENTLKEYQIEFDE